MNNGYISGRALRYSLIGILITALALIGVFLLSDSVISNYKFSAGLTLKFDLNKWRLVNQKDIGDLLINKNNDTYILLTAAKIDDSTETLELVTDSRLELLQKDNIKIEKEFLKINGLDFIKLDYKDYGDENIKSQTNLLGYSTLHNGTYITIQIFYSSLGNLNEALEVVNSITNDQ